MHVISRKALRQFGEEHPDLEIMSSIAKNIQHHWAVIRPMLTIRDEHDYDQAVERLNGLIDEVGTDDGHPLYGLLDTLGTVMQAYEQEHHAMPACRGGDMLQFLMEEHGLTPADLPEIGSEKTVSAILQGQKELEIEQIRALATRFNVSPAVFI